MKSLLARSCLVTATCIWSFHKATCEVGAVAVIILCFQHVGVSFSCAFENKIRTLHKLKVVRMVEQSSKYINVLYKCRISSSCFMCLMLFVAV